MATNEFTLREAVTTPEGTLLFGYRHEVVLVPGDQWEVPAPGVPVVVHHNGQCTPVQEIWVDGQRVFRRAP